MRILFGRLIYIVDCTFPNTPRWVMTCLCKSGWLLVSMTPLHINCTLTQCSDARFPLSNLICVQHVHVYRIFLGTLARSSHICQFTPHSANRRRSAIDLMLKPAVSGSGGFSSSLSSCLLVRRSLSICWGKLKPNGSANSLFNVKP